MIHFTRYFKRSERAFSLIEVSLALGVAAFCLVAILGLLPTGVNSDQQSLEQTAGAGIANAVVADLQSTPLSSATSTHYQLPMPKSPSAKTTQGTAVSPSTSSTPVPHVMFLDANGNLAAAVDSPVTTVSANNPPRYRVSIYYSFPATGTSNASNTTIQTISVRVLVTWPALADSIVAANGYTPINFSGSFETVTSLDRN